MKSIIAFLLIFGGIATNAFSEKIYGNYQGIYKTNSNQTGDIFAQVIAENENQYKAIIRVGTDEKSALGGVLYGEGNENSASFVGRIDISYDAGGAFRLEGKIVKGIFAGDISGGDLTGSVELKRVVKKSATLGKKPPENALVLFDGTNLDQWKDKKNGNATAWRVLPDSSMQVAKGSIITKQTFKDCIIHLEFRTPFMPSQKGQKRGNSGVYVQGLYEIQILDSFGLSGADNECGGIYKIARPDVNACLPPLEWQSYDIIFRAAKFNGNQKIKNAVLTVRHNGILIHDELEIPKITGGAITKDESLAGGLMLQDHKDPVQYRNIWIQPLGDKKESEGKSRIH
jgi:hypothetical protein